MEGNGYSRCFRIGKFSIRLNSGFGRTHSTDDTIQVYFSSSVSLDRSVSQSQKRFSLLFNAQYLK